MKFKFARPSLSFEFIYGKFEINVADYLLGTVDRGLQPEGKVSIYISQGGIALSTKSLERLAAYIKRHIDGIVSVGVNTLDISLCENDQFMRSLIGGLDLLFPV